MDDKELPFSEHLEELRQRLIRSFLAIFAGVIGCFAFKRDIFTFLKKPMDQAFEIARKIDPAFPPMPSVMSYKDPIEPFLTQLKVALLAGVFLAIPVVTYQIWKFIAPGLYKHERKATLPFMASALCMFSAGAGFCYFAVLPFGYGYLLTYGGSEFQPMIMMQEYLKLTARLLIAFGLIFQFPVFIIFLSRIGLVTPATLVKFRKYAVVLVFVVAAIVTPPDVITQILLAIPLVLLYEASILGARILGRGPGEIVELAGQDTEPSTGDQAP